MSSTPAISRSSYILRWALVILWAALIFFMSSRTVGQLNEGIFAQVNLWINEIAANVFHAPIDMASYIAHFCEYVVLGVLLARALRLSTSTGIACCMAVVLASLYGVSDEIHQVFVEGRSSEMVDWIVDTAGALLGSAGSSMFFALRRLR